MQHELVTASGLRNTLSNSIHEAPQERRTHKVLQDPRGFCALRPLKFLCASPTQDKGERHAAKLHLKAPALR